MNIVEAGYTILRPQTLDENSRKAILQIIEAAGRTCYKSEDLMTETSASGFVKKIMSRKHYGLLEHAVMTVKWTVDIGVGREMVRHRIASYAQESTRYCNYSKHRFGAQITVVRPWKFEPGTRSFDTWRRQCQEAEQAYFDLL